MPARSSTSPIILSRSWGRTYYDDALFKQGLKLHRAITLAPNVHLRLRSRPANAYGGGDEGRLDNSTEKAGTTESVGVFAKRK